MKKVDVVRSLYELSEATMSAKDLHEVFDNILDKAMKIVGVTKASIMRYDNKDGVLKIIAAKGMPKEMIETVRVKAGEGISGKVFKTKKAIVISDSKKESRTLKNKRYKTRSLISAPVTSVPLKVSGRPVGVINMTDKKNGMPFTDEDLMIVSTIASQAASFIHIYDLAQSLKETEKLSHEIELARKIQFALLPDETPKLHGLDVAGKCLMASRIGGDYYDYLTSGWAPPAFVIADVSGHDVGAALMMSAFRSALKAEVGIPVLPPSTVIRRMNRVLFHDLVRSEQFISMAYLQYIDSSKTLRYATAGHHPVLLYNAKRKGFKELATDGPLLGLEKGEHFSESKCTIEKGDIVVMYTDGVVETRNDKGKQFGTSRLKQAISKHAGSAPRAMVEAISKDVKVFAGMEPIKDDITLVVLKFK